MVQEQHDWKKTQIFSRTLAQVSCQCVELLQKWWPVLVVVAVLLELCALLELSSLSPHLNAS